ncbi:MAG TPA: hypothetical protein VMS77_00930 [Conexivisphaerales archaeon]|nr:hypothetical protein [Conexivisphaerales archaeon]
MEHTRKTAKAILRLEATKVTPKAGEVEKKLAATEGVLRVQVNNLAHTLYIWYDPAVLTIYKLKRHVHEAFS